MLASCPPCAVLPGHNSRWFLLMFEQVHGIKERSGRRLGVSVTDVPGMPYVLRKFTGSGRLSVSNLCQGCESCLRI